MAKKEKLSTESYKGVRDFYPEDQALLNYITQTMRMVAERVGYVEYHASILEPAELYKAKGSENEEIVSEQTYTFLDRGGREVTLRPEMTPTAARMVAARRRELGFPLRLYSIPNVFRYERPQRGRLREHWQLNVDLFGTHNPAADAEILAVAYGIMRAFGAENSDFIIKVSSRKILDEALIKADLDKDAQKKVRKLLDKKDKLGGEKFDEELRAIAGSGFKLELKPDADLEKILQKFKDEGIDNIVFDPGVVRGFDYYTGLVFEVYDTHPQNSRALFGGGRYDNLTELFDDEPLPGVGFGMGDVTIVDFLSVRNMLPPYRSPTHVYLTLTSGGLAFEAQKLAGEMRQRGVNVAMDFGDKKLADQIKTATKHKIPYLIVVGENELQSGTYVVRELETGKETPLTRAELGEFFLKLR